MYQDEEIHAELLAKFREYFEANQEWLAKGTKRSAIKLRRIMSDIRRICSRRRVVVREWAEWKEAQLEAKEAQRQNQKRHGTDTSSDN